MRFQACTIITRSYLPYARVLYRSFQQFHPEIKFTALVFDAEPDTIHEPFDVCVLNDIDLPPGEEGRMPMLYDLTEFATALKPWFFRHLLAQEKSVLLYFDPDTQLFSAVDRLATLAGQHCLVVTPHTTRPMTREDVRPNETDILGAGAYNLGFLGLNPDCDAFLSWWSERLLREAMIDPVNMRFTDQRWMDFAPGYFDTCIVKDETCNVAYWNADTRPLSWTGSRYEVNGQPLCFFHFSGFKPENPHLLSIHQGNNPRTRLSDHPALARLCHEYAGDLEKADYTRLRQIRYRWSETPGGLKITAPMRLAYRTALQKHESSGAPAPPTPFDNQTAFIEWLNEPMQPQRCPEMTRYFHAIHATRGDLRAAFPNLIGPYNDAYYEWLRDFGRHEIPIPGELMPPPRIRASSMIGRNGSITRTRGVALTGYLRAEVGTGESGRLMTAAVEASGEKYSTHICLAARSRQQQPWSGDLSFAASDYDTNLICINADELPMFAQEVGPDFFRDRYNIGFWFWETELFPATMHAGFNCLHEVWVTSEFNREAIARVSPIPVYTVPHPMDVDLAPDPKITRASLNLPEGFLFLFSFDFFSVMERKNPIAVIEAFKKAFKPGEGPGLVIKSINGDRNLAELEHLHYARGDRSDIIIRDGYVNAAERTGLTNTCDCYVSLHRAEGFGLTIAEAMLLEKPAIATGYSGNLEFMTDANSFLCGYKLQRVGPGCAPYPSEARWANPNIGEAASLMRFVYENPEEARCRGKQARIDVAARHAPKVIGEFIKKRLTELRRKPPLPVPFNVFWAERPVLTKVRTAIAQGANVRRIVPSLLTWILQGPRRAMKRCLRAYDEHHQRLGIFALDVFKDIDAESMGERAALKRRIWRQQDEIHLLKKQLKETLDRVSKLEQERGIDRPLNKIDAGSRDQKQESNGEALPFERSA